MGGFSSFNLLFWVLFFYFLILIVQISTACVVHERIALLQIKDHLNSVSQSDGDSILSSWEEHSDCCKWEHVECDDSTGQITNLYLGSTVLAQDPWTLNLTYFQPIKQLQSLHLDGNNIQSLARSQVVGPSLEKLQVIDLRGNNLQDDGIIPLDSLISLHELHLSDNNLNGASLSKVLSKLKNLKWLNAENNQLRGTIANLGICQTTRLQNLFLGNNDLEGDLPNCIGKFSFLQTLGLSYNKLFGDAASIIPIPISLELFDIEGNKFEGNFPIKTLFNHSKLQYLSLSSNLLEIIFEDQQKQPMFQLKFLNLSGCHINWQLKGFQNFLSSQYNLDLLNLGSNNLSGSIPAWIWQNKSNLQQISLYNNSITGDFSFHNQTMLSLKVVILSNNKLSGPLPHNIGSAMPNLINLDMSKNSIKGLIPESIGEMLKLNMLDLSHNNLSGDIPRELFTNCISLEVLVLSYNHLHGNLFPKYANFPQLRWLELQNNNFSGALQDTLLKSSHFLSFMDISHNEITGRIPTWISGLQELVVLSLAHNQLRGTIPREVCKLEYLEYIDFSKNKLTGGIPACCSPSLKFLHLHNNNLGGAIANTLSNCSKLITLDLSHNQLSKEIPTSIDQLLNLKVLLLGHNKLQGQLPIQLCKLGDINIMDLSNNDISDAMLSCFANLSFGTIRLEDFDFNGGMLKGKWFSKENIISIKVAAITVHIYIAMNLRRSYMEEVEFITKSRQNSYKSSVLNLMSGLDLSMNRLSGKIPSEIGMLKDIHALNLSHNSLFGSIPNSFFELVNIESLDLSFNKLDGEIPTNLVNLNFLEYFNVSYNNLSGRMPETSQFASFDGSSYIQNPLLCGSLLAKPCTYINNQSEGSAIKRGDDQEQNTQFDFEFFFWSFVVSELGFNFLPVSPFLFVESKISLCSNDKPSEKTHGETPCACEGHQRQRSDRRGFLGEQLQRSSRK